MINLNDVRDVQKYARLYRIYRCLDQGLKDKIDQWGKYGFWALDLSHPREDRLALALKDLGIYVEPPDIHSESDEMTGGAEEYDEIMAAHELMNVR